jgi:hypothetical protein
MTLKISTFSKDITPQPGVLLAGYGPDVVSKAIHDPLFIKGIALDDGKQRTLLLSFDLIGLDRDFVVAIRKACSKIVDIPAENVVLTCTHTHSGPHTRHLANLNLSGQRLKEFEQYKSFLIESSADAVLNSFSVMNEVDVFHYSAQCHENINRRYISPDNKCTYIPTNKHLIPLANNITDPELGMIYFVDSETKEPLATIVNYTAHPLTCQSEGLASHLISADYPGVLRCEVEKQLGGNCIFISGACGDIHPKGFESGFSRTEEMGKTIAQKVINCYSNAIWNPEKYLMSSIDLGIELTSVKLAFRKTGCIEARLPLYAGKDAAEAELQILSIGDIALVGVPGELLCSPGLEIKWNSPFRKTFILYNSTAYLSYLPPANYFKQGGYEVDCCHFEPEETFKIIFETIKTLNKLKEEEL